MILTVSAPLAGEAIALHDVPDPVFAESLVGPGMAIVPRMEPQTVLAPVTGLLLKLKPHAFVVVGAASRSVLVHLGIDTVRMEGVAFELLAEEGQEVTVGDPIIRWYPDQVRKAGFSSICPVIALDAAPEEFFAGATGLIMAGSKLFTWGANG